ncbi:MAG: response regulator [Myxococcales bacterium]
MDGESPKGVRILAVDDIESNLVALEAVLQGSSISLVRANSGYDALRALLDDEFALILMDVQMPEMDGFETATAIRQRKKSSRIPIIFLTAHGSSAEKVARAYAIGAADFLTKPLDPDVLRAKVEAIADLWRKVEETKGEAKEETERRLAEQRHQWETETLRARVAAQEKATATEQMARLEAESANRMKDEFLATLSHELRTPMSAILGWASTLKLKGTVTDPAVARGLDAIERNALLQAKLIDDLLDSSRIAAGKVRLDLQGVDLEHILTSVTDTLRPVSAQKQVALHSTIDGPLLVIAGDPDRLQQVFTNVVSNAIQFTPAGGRVELRAAKVGPRIQVQVTDTGVGIALQFLPHVFDRFRQGDGSTTRVHGGLGIGLSVARQLVGLHGGTISAHSEGPGTGATFTILLPVPAVVPADGLSPIAPPIEVRDPSESSQLDGVRALVVDDEADSRELVREVLTTAGAAVLAVDSADSAYTAFLDWRPDVIVSDIGMPGQDGYTLMTRIRALPQGTPAQVPAVALTAYAGADDVAKAHAAGFQSHLAKPVDPWKLMSTVVALVKTRRTLPP